METSARVWGCLPTSRAPKPQPRWHTRAHRAHRAHSSPCTHHSCRNSRPTRDASGELRQEWELRGNVSVQNLLWHNSHRAPREMSATPHFIHWCLFLHYDSSCCGGERLKSTQPLLLAPEKAPSKLTIRVMLEEQLPFLCSHTLSAADREKEQLAF